MVIQISHLSYLSPFSMQVYQHALATTEECRSYLTNIQEWCISLLIRIFWMSNSNEIELSLFNYRTPNFNNLHVRTKCVLRRNFITIEKILLNAFIYLFIYLFSYREYVTSSSRIASIEEMWLFVLRPIVSLGT